MNYVSVENILNKAITRVFHLVTSDIDEFIERRILVQISGFGFIELDQEEPLLESHRLLMLSGFALPANAQLVLSDETHPELSSPIAALFRPFGWEHSIGIMLENGFVLHNSFSMNDNGVTFYQPIPELLNEFSFILGVGSPIRSNGK